MPAIIDKPDCTRPVDRHGFMVRGWVWLGDEQPEIAAVEAWSGDTLLGEGDTLLRRADVNSAQGLGAEARTGFELVARHAGAQRGSAFDLQLRVRRRDGTRTDVLREQRVQSLGDGPQPPTGSFPDAQIAVPAGATPVFEPPPHLQVRQVAGVWGAAFYAVGGVMFGQLAEVFRAAGRPLESAEAILDFGCGCGRVLRSFRDFPHTGEIWGCDIDAESIAWNRANLGAGAKFSVNSALPPTGFRDGQFDAIYAVSVFTHLPEEMQFAWLSELRRLLRPGGVLVASLHGARYWNNSDAGVIAEVAARGYAYREGPRTEGLPDFYMAAYHSEAYVRERWSRFFEFVDLRESFLYGVHDVAVLRRRAED